MCTIGHIFFAFFNAGRYAIFTICCHSSGGDAAVALSDLAFYMIYIQSPQGNNATALAEFALFGCS